MRHALSSAAPPSACCSAAGRSIACCCSCGSLLLVFYVGGPVVWLVSSSLQPEAEITAGAAELDPARADAEQFRAIFTAGERESPTKPARRAIPRPAASSPRRAENLLPALWNSFMVGVAVAVLNLLVSCPPPTRIAMIHFRGRQTSLYSILVTRVIPDIALIVPLFLVIRNLGLINTRLR